MKQKPIESMAPTRALPAHGGNPAVPANDTSKASPDPVTLLVIRAHRSIALSRLQDVFKAREVHF